MRLAHPILAFIGLCSMVGCGPSTVDLRRHLDFHQSSFHEKVAADAALTRRFLACTARNQGGRAELGDTTIAPVHALIQRIRQRRPVEADSLSVLEALSADFADRSRRRFDLSGLHRIVEAVRQWHSHLDFDEEDLLRDTSRFVRLLAAYNRAYFGDLRFVSESTSTGRGPRQVIARTSSGFVDRSGNVFLFPALSQDHPASDPAMRPIARSVTSQTVSADLTRIFLEAFFDAAFEVPAVKGATALRVEWATGESPYPEFDADHPAIALTDLARVTRDALRAEAAVTMETGKIVRGAGVFGTGNETVAASVETAAGVIAKKLVEHEGFCYFQTMQQAEKVRETPSQPN